MVAAFSSKFFTLKAASLLSQEKTYGARDEKRAYFCLATFYSPNGKIELGIYAKAKGRRAQTFLHSWFYH